MRHQHRLRADMNLLDDTEDAEVGPELASETPASPSWRLGASMCVAVMLTAFAFAAPAYLTGLNPLDLAMPADDGLAPQRSLRLAFEDRTFLIEPAAGPSQQDELEICRRILAEEIRCEP